MLNVVKRVTIYFPMKRPILGLWQNKTVKIQGFYPRTSLYLCASLIAPIVVQFGTGVLAQITV